MTGGWPCFPPEEKSHTSVGVVSLSGAQPRPGADHIQDIVELRQNYQLRVQRCADLRDELHQREKEVRDLSSALHRAEELAMQREDCIAHFHARLARTLSDLSHVSTERAHMEHKLEALSRARQAVPASALEEALLEKDKYMSCLDEDVRAQQKQIEMLTTDVKKLLNFIMQTNIEATEAFVGVTQEQVLPKKVEEYLRLSEYSSASVRHLRAKYDKYLRGWRSPEATTNSGAVEATKEDHGIAPVSPVVEGTHRNDIAAQKVLCFPDKDDGGATCVEGGKPEYSPPKPRFSSLNGLANFLLKPVKRLDLDIPSAATMLQKTTRTTTGGHEGQKTPDIPALPPHARSDDTASDTNVIIAHQEQEEPAAPRDPAHHVSQTMSSQALLPTLSELMLHETSSAISESMGTEPSSRPRIPLYSVNTTKNFDIEAAIVERQVVAEANCADWDAAHGVQFRSGWLEYHLACVRGDVEYVKGVVRVQEEAIRMGLEVTEQDEAGRGPLVVGLDEKERVEDGEVLVEEKKRSMKGRKNAVMKEGKKENRRNDSADVEQGDVSNARNNLADVAEDGEANNATSSADVAEERKLEDLKDSLAAMGDDEAPEIENSRAMKRYQRKKKKATKKHEAMTITEKECDETAKSENVDKVECATTSTCDSFRVLDQQTKKVSNNDAVTRTAKPTPHSHISTIFQANNSDAYHSRLSPRSDRPPSPPLTPRPPKNDGFYDATTLSGFTGLFLAAFCRQAEVCAVLLSAKAPAHSCDFRGNTCLHAAFMRFPNGCIPLLLAANADVGSLNYSSQQVPLHKYRAPGISCVAATSLSAHAPPCRVRYTRNSTLTAAGGSPGGRNGEIHGKYLWEDMWKYVTGTVRKDRVSFLKREQAKLVVQLTTEEIEDESLLSTCYVTNYTYNGLDHAIAYTDGDTDDYDDGIKTRQALVCTSQRLLLLYEATFSLAFQTSLLNIDHIIVSAMSAVLFVVCTRENQGLVLDVQGERRNVIIDELRCLCEGVSGRNPPVIMMEQCVPLHDRPLAEPAALLAFLRDEAFLILKYDRNSVLLRRNTFFFGFLYRYLNEATTTPLWELLFFTLLSSPTGGTLVWSVHPMDPCAGQIELSTVSSVLPVDTPNGDLCIIVDYHDDDGEIKAMTLRAETAAIREDWVVSLRTMHNMCFGE